MFQKYLIVLCVDFCFIQQVFSEENLVNKTEVTSVKLVLFKSVMSFETLTKVDRLAEIVRTRPGLTVVLSSV